MNLILLTLALTMADTTLSRQYVDSLHNFRLTFPESISIHVLNSLETNISSRQGLLCRLSILSLDDPVYTLMPTDDPLARTAIDGSLYFADGPDGGEECRPSDHFSFGTLNNGLRFVKFYLNRTDYYTHQKTTHRIVGPFFGIDITRGKGKYVLLIVDAWHTPSTAQKEEVFWDIVRSISLVK